jgi:hypothetical protein
MTGKAAQADTKFRPNITRLSRNPYSLGLAVRYLAGIELFTQFEFGGTVSTIMHQINDGSHLILEQNDLIVGYLGWLRTSVEIAEAWSNEGARLQKVPGGDAIVVTIFHAENPAYILRMVRAAKQVEPDTPVYWKRFYSDNRSPAPRAVKLNRAHQTQDSVS